MKSMKKTMVRQLCCFFFILLLFCVPARAAEEGVSPVSMEVSAVFGGVGRMGCHVPLVVSLYGQSEAPFTGTVNVRTLENGPDGDGEIYEYSYPVTVGTAEMKRMEIYVRLGQRSSEMVVSLKDEKGREVETKNLSFDMSRSRGQLLIGALSDESDRLEFLDGANLDYGMVSSHLIPMDIKTFPEDARGLEVLDILLINHFDSAALSEKQREAILGWMEAGGVVLFGTGDMVYETLEPFFEVFPGLSILETVRESVSMGVEYAENAPGDAIVDMVCTELWISGGTAAMESDGRTLLTMVNRGKGKAGVFAYDLGDIHEFAKERPAYVVRLLTDVLGENTISYLYFYSSYGRDEDYWNAQSLVNTGSADRIPKLPLYAAVSVIYIFAAGPGLYYILKKRDLSRYYGGAVVAASLITSAVIYLMGTGTRFTSEFYTVATVLDAEGDTVRETSYLNIRTPDSRPFSVKIPADYEVTPITETGRYEDQPVLEFDKKRSANVGIRRESDGTVLSARRSRAFEPRYFKLERASEPEFPGSVEGELKIFDGRISGYVKNEYSFPLTNAALLLYGQMYPLGDLAPGEIRSLEDEPLTVWPVTYSYLMAEWLSGSGREDLDDGEYIRSVERNSLYYYFLDEYYSVYTPEVRITGFGPENGLWNTISSEGQATDGQVLYTARIDTTFRQDGVVYRSGLINPPAANSGSGSYASDGIAMYGTDPVAVEYFLGTDIEVEKVSFLPISEEFIDSDRRYYLKRFDGEAYFYNHETKNYDRAELFRVDFSGEELEPYLSPEGSLIVKYVGNEADETGSSVLLPVPMVTGRER